MWRCGVSIFHRDGRILNFLGLASSPSSTSLFPLLLPFFYAAVWRLNLLAQQSFNLGSFQSWRQLITSFEVSILEFIFVKFVPRYMRWVRKAVDSRHGHTYSSWSHEHGSAREPFHLVCLHYTSSPSVSRFHSQDGRDIINGSGLGWTKWYTLYVTSTFAVSTRPTSIVPHRSSEVLIDKAPLNQVWRWIEVTSACKQVNQTTQFSKEFSKILDRHTPNPFVT